jgi:hypothetical protein
MKGVGWAFAVAIGLLAFRQLGSSGLWTAVSLLCSAWFVRWSFSRLQDVQLRLKDGRVSVIDFGVSIDRAENTKAAIEQAIASQRKLEFGSASGAA